MGSCDKAFCNNAREQLAKINALSYLYNNHQTSLSSEHGVAGILCTFQSYFRYPVSWRNSAGDNRSGESNFLLHLQ